MDDLISRQAAITAIQKAYCDTCGGEDKYAVWKNVGLTEALHGLQDLPSAQPAQRWIPCSERLPGEFVSVQAHMTDAESFSSVREAYLAGGEWFFPALNEYHPVDKWAEFLESSEEKCYVQEKVR